MAQQVLQSTWVLFTTYRFNWTELDNGLSLSVVGVTAAVVQGGLTRVLVPKWGERRALVTGILVTATAFTAYGLATQGWMLYAILVVGAVGGIAGPSAQALISRQVGPSEQGSVQGALQSLMSLTGVVGPVVFTHLFGFFTSPAAPFQVPGVAFFGGALLMVMGALLALRSFSVLGKPAPEAPLPLPGVAHG
jgi:DHA1 family tetracycline resistance protein-like MFS transporter